MIHNSDFQVFIPTYSKHSLILRVRSDSKLPRHFIQFAMDCVSEHFSSMGRNKIQKILGYGYYTLIQFPDEVLKKIEELGIERFELSDDMTLHDQLDRVIDDVSVACFDDILNN